MVTPRRQPTSGGSEAVFYYFRLSATIGPVFAARRAGSQHTNLR
jgi:hypothetical protein